MTQDQRQHFDRLVTEVIENLPGHVRALLDEVPVIVLDRPTPEMVRSLGMTDEDASELCGLHTGVALTDRSVEHSAVMPDEVHLFREGIVGLVGGWDADDAENQIYEEIRITILHELGHHHGLDEDDLEALGYD